MAPPSAAPVYETPELSDLDHAIYEYLCLRGFNSIAQAFMSSTFHAGGSIAVPMSSLYRFWHNMPGASENRPPSPATSTTSEPPLPADVTVVQAAADTVHRCTWPDCSQSFRKKSNLQRHMLLHEGRRPYRCLLTLADGSTCGKTYARESDLAAHVRVHNGVRPFTCPDCGKTFTRNSDWRAHVKAVHGQAPYACPGSGCGGRFETLKELRAHFLLCPEVAAATASGTSTTPDDALVGPVPAAVPISAAAAVAVAAAPCQVSTCSHKSPSSASPKRFICSGHGQPSFQVRHDDHFDFLIDGELHHWTDKYCESHGLFNLIDYTPSTAAPSSSSSQ